MREAVFAVLLVLSAFAGCLQEGEEIQETDVDAPDNSSEADGGQQGEGDDTDDTSESSSDNDNGDDETTNQDDEADDDQASGGSGDGGDGNDAPKRVPWNLTKEIRLGYQAGVGVHFLPSDVTGQLSAAGAPTEVGVPEDPYCPRANVTVPKTTAALSIALDGALVDASEPGVGAYELEIAGPSGENATIGGLEAVAPGPAGGGSMNWSSEEVSAGVWTLDADMAGPVVQQTWTATIEADGMAKNAPTELPLELICS